MFILSQVLVCFSDVLEIISMLCKKKINLVLFLLISDILFATHCLVLGALTGSIIVYLEVIFLLVTYVLELKNKERYVPFVVVIIALLSIMSCILTWDGLLSLLLIIGMLSYLTGMMFKNVVVVKISAILKVVLNVIYLICIDSYIGAVLETVIFLSGIIGIIVNIKSKRKLNPKNT